MSDGGPATGPRAWEVAGLAAAMVLPTAAAWLYFFTFAEARFMLGIYAGCKVVQFTLPLAWVGLGVLRIPPLSAVPTHGLPRGLGWGAAMAAVLGVTYVLLIRDGALAAAAAPRVAARIEAIGATTPLAFLAMTLLISVVHSFLEEYYWRWLVFGRLRAWRGSSTAGLVSSLAFAGHHAVVLHAFIGPGSHGWMTGVLSLAVVLGGVIWARLYVQTGTLLAPWASHVLVDLAIFAIGFDLAWGLVTPP